MTTDVPFRVYPKGRQFHRRVRESGRSAATFLSEESRVSRRVISLYKEAQRLGG